MKLNMDSIFNLNQLIKIFSLTVSGSEILTNVWTRLKAYYFLATLSRFSPRVIYQKLSLSFIHHFSRFLCLLTCGFHGGRAIYLLWWVTLFSTIPWCHASQESVLSNLLASRSLERLSGTLIESLSFDQDSWISQGASGAAAWGKVRSHRPGCGCSTLLRTQRVLALSILCKAGLGSELPK